MKIKQIEKHLSDCGLKKEQSKTVSLISGHRLAGSKSRIDPRLFGPKQSNTHGGKRQNAGRKPGPNGPASARLNIKCTPAEMAAWTEAAKAKKMTRSEWVKILLNYSSR